MAKSDKSRQLNIEQENAIDLLLLGKSDREVSEAVGVSRQTVTEWRNNHPAFIAELNRRRTGLWETEIDRLRAMVREALGVLAYDLRQEDDLRARRAAAVHILKAVGIYGGKWIPEGPESIQEAQRNMRNRDW